MLTENPAYDHREQSPQGTLPRCVASCGRICGGVKIERSPGRTPDSSSFAGGRVALGSYIRESSITTESAPIRELPVTPPKAGQRRRPFHIRVSYRTRAFGARPASFQKKTGPSVPGARLCGCPRLLSEAIALRQQRPRTLSPRSCAYAVDRHATALRGTRGGPHARIRSALPSFLFPRPQSARCLTA